MLNQRQITVVLEYANWFAKAFTVVLYVLTAVFLATGVLGVASVAVQGSGLMELEFAANFSSPDDMIVALALLLGAAGCWLASMFLKRLTAIIENAGKGNPLDEDNLTRLWEMGGLAMAANFVTFAMEMAGRWHHSLTGNARAMLVEDAGIVGVLVGALLITLASVFQTGTHKRDEAEGNM